MRNSNFGIGKTVLMCAVLFTAGAGCVDDVDMDADNNSIFDDGGVGTEPGEAPQFCSAENASAELGNFMELFSDGSFVASTRVDVANCQISRFAADGTVMWHYTPVGRIAWIGSSPSDGNTALLSLVDNSTSNDDLDASGFLTLIDKNGQELWSRHIADGPVSGLNWQAAEPQMAAAIAPDGSIVAAAAFNGEIVLGEGEANETTLGAGGQSTPGTYVARFNATGSLATATQLSTPLVPFTLAVTESDDIVLAGTSSFFNIVLTALSSKGKELWSEPVINYSAEWPVDLSNNGIRLLPSADGTFVLTGKFYADIIIHDETGKSVPLSSAQTAGTLTPNYFLARFSADGTLQWARAGEFADVKNRAIVFSSSIVGLANGGVSLAGMVKGSVTFENLDGGTTVIDEEYYTATYDNAGNLTEAIPFSIGLDPTKTNFQILASEMLSDGAVMYAAFHSGSCDIGDMTVVECTMSFTFADGALFTGGVHGGYLFLKTCVDGQ